mmetsp:Transcript_8679/g.22453  ORF Transcript_8679/g.22453 Transcript_8679/m.22453 type:complete len:139 (-) Transcript_8679:105-521(-)
MATEQELATALKGSLERSGVLDGLRARLRAEVFGVISQGEPAPPRMTRHQLLINELIREYMSFHKLGHSESVFVPETGSDAEPLSRQYITEELNLKETAHSAKVPLLYGIISLLIDGGLASDSAPAAGVATDSLEGAE